MIRYKKQITLDRRRNGSWRIMTDCGDDYDTTIYDDINDWWKTQIQNELRGWQKDICIKDTADIFGKLEMFNIYQKGKGWIQNHDICLMHSSHYKMWVLSTENDFWICTSDANNITFDVEDSLGSILEFENRQVIYSIFNELKKEYNPTNECRWIAY